MKYTPLKCQSEGAEFILSNNSAGLFFRMGIGKTVTGLTAVEEMIFNYCKVSRVLVVAPKRVALITWPDEIAKWDHVNHLTYVVLHGNDKDDLIKHTWRVNLTIINYEGLAWMWRNKGKFPRYDVVVFDESTYAKNPGSERTKIAHKIARDIPLVNIFTGTPKPNGIENLWSQVYLLDRGKNLGYNITTFRNNYLYQKSQRLWVPRAGARDEIIDKIKDLVMVVESENLEGMPDVKDNVIGIELPPKIRKIYDRAEGDFIIDLDDNVTLELLNDSKKNQKLRQISSGFVYDDYGEAVKLHEAKLEALGEIVTTINRNVLVSIQYKYEIEMIRQYFKRYIPAIYSGSSEKEDMKNIRAWNGGSVDMMLVHPASIAHGLNMQTGGYDLISYSLMFDMELWEQLIARLKRRGQKAATVMHHILVARGTMDELMYRVLRDKVTDQEEVMRCLKEWRKNR
jgi:hypothetical protein